MVFDQNKNNHLHQGLENKVHLVDVMTHSDGFILPDRENTI